MKSTLVPSLFLAAAVLFSGMAIHSQAQEPLRESIRFDRAGKGVKWGAKSARARLRMLTPVQRATYGHQIDILADLPDQMRTPPSNVCSVYMEMGTGRFRAGHSLH